MKHPELRAAGYFGSYARGDWGVGSDVDLVVIVDASQEPFIRRGLAFEILSLPVPAELLVYTQEEWRRLVAQKEGFAARLQHETVWVLQR